ncbi:BREX-4 system phosphatase PglZ [Lachnoclostridium sp. An138]|uniref:BREX-4 system phosphatase PglZ n=1 Tax=Lachnoclostridium sp. An138 TaxID=1965560 RepID=UPI000B371F31|nr:BREX-4 system phosphatase PglZ [Lachnoclostridium sp. An138]OUQ18289.1 hypothetical protein B5E82_08865 [Lachnoclostridium sp. An138]
MNMNAINDYFASKLHKPFFMVVGDKEYGEIINCLKSRAISIICVSDCCRSEDKVPDMDVLRQKLETADVSCDYNDVVLLGLGEYLALSGETRTKDILSELVNYNLGSAQVVLLLRCVSTQVKELVKSDKRLLESGRVVFGDDLGTAVSFKFSAPGLGIYELNGIKNVLKTLETGVSGAIFASTVIEFKDSILPVQRVRDSYEAISRKLNMCAIPKECGIEEMWRKLLSELRDKEFRINEIFSDYGFLEYQDAELYEFLYEEEYRSWLFYIYLRVNEKLYDGKYLGYVLGKSIGIESFKYNVKNAIIDIPHEAPTFPTFYKERKKLLSNYPEPEMASFVSKNRVNEKESVYKLTDNTLVERQEIIIWIACHGIPDNLAVIYPDLALYMKKYSFSGKNLDPDFAARLTTYFERYKELKLRNLITEDFLNEVDKLARERIYNRLPSRDELVKKTYSKSTQLFWIDALGVEYLSYIIELAKRYGLKIQVEIGRALLPTITCENSDFFRNWPEDLRHSKEEELDDIKHNDKGGYYYSSKNPYPIHLAKELEIIERAMNDIATNLGLGKYERVVITSDHGSSRLAVLRNKEEKYETDTKGEHSGRCCKFFPDCDLPFAISEEERGYIVLADYGRFKGSRAANVEVHGGASLEEVVVPLITLSLNDSSIEISIVDGEKIKADPKIGIKILLFVNKEVQDILTLSYGSMRYPSEKVDDNHYVVKIPDIRRAGTYPADVYFGEDLAAHIEIKAMGKSASMNDEFDALF